MTRLIVLAGLAFAASVARAEAPEPELSDYTIEQLMAPCLEADNDSRWGAAAETECEQYIRGFTDAYILVTDNGVCLPALNRDDEVRWAFMKWVRQNHADRFEPAAEGLMATLKEAFKCP